MPRRTRTRKCGCASRLATLFGYTTPDSEALGGALGDRLPLVETFSSSLLREIPQIANLNFATCGHIEGEFGRLMEGGEGKIRVPIPVFLIEHPKGRALFDTGLHPDCQHDPAGRLGERMTNLFKISFRRGEEVSARLEAMDRDPARINLVINSHFRTRGLALDEIAPPTE
jgi:hypothetical protein